MTNSPGMKSDTPNRVSRVSCRSVDAVAPALRDWLSRHPSPPSPSNGCLLCGSYTPDPNLPSHFPARPPLPVESSGLLPRRFAPCSAHPKKAWTQTANPGLSDIPGGDLLSHKVSQAVPSALEGLTTLFGMERGVSPPLWLPENHIEYAYRMSDAKRASDLLKI